MQTVAVELMARLGDTIETVKDLSKLHEFDLQALETRLPRNAPAGSAEMVMLMLVYREMDQRKQ
jgi:hypothetical protein